MPPTQRLPKGVGLAIGVLLLAGPPGSRAAEVDLRLTQIGEGYQTRTADGDLWNRRRIIQWVDLRAAQLFEVDSLGLDLSFRFDTELGSDLRGREQTRPDLLRAQVAWRTLGGRLLLTAGRQVIWDELDCLFVDGVRLEYQFPGDFTVRLLAGFEVQGQSFMGGEVLTLDGTERAAAPAPLVGANLYYRFRDVWASLDYRRVVLWADDFPLTNERIGASLSARLLRRTLGLEVGGAFNLLTDAWDRVRADAWLQAPAGLPRALRGFRLEAGVLRSRPHFAQDSIFNFFSPAPFDELHAGVHFRDEERLRVRVAYARRVYRAGEGAGLGLGKDDRGVDGVDLDGAYTVSAATWLGAFAAFEDGAAGRRWLVAPRLGLTVWADRLWLEGRALLSAFADPVQENQHALTTGGSLGATLRLGGAHALILVAELNSNRFHPAAVRVLAVLDLAFGYASRRGIP